AIPAATRRAGLACVAGAVCLASRRAAGANFTGVARGGFRWDHGKVSCNLSVRDLGPAVGNCDRVNHYGSLGIESPVVSQRQRRLRLRHGLLSRWFWLWACGVRWLSRHGQRRLL